MIQHHYAGLTDNQVIKQREKFGDNSLTAPKQTSTVKKFLEKFKDTIIIILLVALLASVCVSFYEFYFENATMSVFLEPLGIFIAVFLATTIGFLFELNADRKFKILNQINEEILYKVMRNGNITEVLKNDLVVDDIVMLNTGEEVPADGEILESVSLIVNESSLTGEPSASKSADSNHFDKEATYPSNMLLRGSSVIEGHCVMKIQKTGNDTEYGKVNIGAQIENNIKTPLNIQLDKLGALITKMSYWVALLVIAGRLLLFFTSSSGFDTDMTIRYFLNTLMIAVTIIVVSVPEGLPMSVTLSLALSMKRMLSTNNLVRKMHACETMGAATVICTDKTGTLTKNMMTVSEVMFPALANDGKISLLYESETSYLISNGIALNSTAYLDKSDSQKIKVLGNPTEGAMLLWLDSQGVDYLSLRENADIIQQLPFSTERKYMATVVKSDTQKRNILFLKGAPEKVLSLCDRYLSNTGEKPVVGIVDDVESQLLAFQNQAMRTLAFAYKYIDGDNVIEDGKITQTSMTFLGIAAISDPVRETVPAAINKALMPESRLRL
jgi:ATPase, P-type (transporting), HAD superfamily, subfamily IC